MFRLFEADFWLDSYCDVAGVRCVSVAGPATFATPSSYNRAVCVRRICGPNCPRHRKRNVRGAFTTILRREQTWRWRIDWFGGSHKGRAGRNHTFLISAMPTLVIAPLINPTDTFRPVENFSQIAYIGGPPVAFVASSSSELKSFDALLRIARERPLNYGTGGVGTVGHLTAAYVAHKANLKLTHIPYNGPMIGDIISGVVDFGSLTASTVLGNIDGGTLRGLAIGTDKRLLTHPEIPTFKELGFDLSPIAWLAIAGPPDMPRELQITLNKEITDILGRPKMKDILKQEMIEPVAMSPQELTAFIRSEITTWTPIVELAGLRK